MTDAKKKNTWGHCPKLSKPQCIKDINRHFFELDSEQIELFHRIHRSRK